MTEARSIMSKNLITVKATTPIIAAYEEMRGRGIRHLPVIDISGILVGILSDRDLLRAANTRVVNEIEQEMTFNPHHTVEDFMSWPVQTVSELTSVEEVARKMIDQKVSAFVVNGPNHYFKGIITTDDLLQYLVELIRGHETIEKIPLHQFFSRHV